MALEGMAKCLLGGKDCRTDERPRRRKTARVFAMFALLAMTQLEARGQGYLSVQLIFKGYMMGVLSIGKKWKL